MSNNIYNSFLPLVGDFPDGYNAKLNQDRYEVYVNGDYVGEKSLLVQTDDITDVDDFLHQEGYTEFASDLDGDHYNINADEASQEDLKNNLKLYLKIR